MIRRLLGAALVVTGIALAGTGTATGAATAGPAWAWGDNADGELGNGTITPYSGLATPGQVKNLTGVAAVAGGSNFSLALTSSGTVWAWGNSGWGQLGQGSYGASTVPVQVPGLTAITAIATGDLHSLALKSNGTVLAWGYNYYGQVGNGTHGNNILSPTQVSGLSGIVAVAAGHGSFTSYALKSDGTVWAWGYDGLGQLGNGTNNENAHPTPVKVSSLTGVTGIAAGDDHGMALRSNGTVWTWGDNQYSQLGAATKTTCSSYHTPCSTVPVQVPSFSGVTAVAGGGSFSLALKSDGTMWGWGDNGYGQLANGTTTPFGGVRTPTKSLLISVTSIAAGDDHSIALKSDGTVWTAGENDFGQLGNGTFNESSSPVQVTNLGGATAIGAGADHSLAVVPAP